jgi:predicted anti-sigma-YlaC factor YlaD
MGDVEMTCHEAALLMNTVLDGEASPDEDQLLQFHINGCSSCRRTMLLNKSLSLNVKCLDEPEPPCDIIEKVRARLNSGNYDKSPIEKQSRKLIPVWRIAALIPFAAALLLLIQNFTGDHISNYRDTDLEAASSGEALTEYTPVPVVAYSRPSSVSTF